MFEKLKVLELASVLAGPSVGQFFAELGAEVIKIENPATGGDVTRSWLFKGEAAKGTLSSYFCSVNWGKKSVLLDLTSKEGQVRLHKLVAVADIVVASYKPGDAEKLGADYQTLSAINQGLIYGHVTGYGSNDPRVGYDAVIQAESGFMSINGEKEGGPLKMPVALMDVLAAHQLKEGLLLALIQRTNTGKGSYVPVSLLEAGLASLANQAANWLVGGAVPRRKGNQHPNIAPYGDVFPTADQREVILAVGNDKQFKSLCSVLGLEIFERAEFKTNTARVQNREELTLMLHSAIEKRGAVSLLTALRKSKVPVGLVQRIDEVLQNANPAILLRDNELTGVRNLVALPHQVSPINLTSPPQLGEHTEQVFSE